MEVILTAIDESILETLDAFVKYQQGFHGDTGIREYLYYRLMTNLGDGAYLDS